MKPIALIRSGSVFLGAALVFAGVAGAQQKASSSLVPSRAYDLHREVSLQGTVVQYRAASAMPPLGPHVTVQTSAGIVDVHLGSARLLAANHISLASGDAVRIFGENVNEANGTQFVARILQKGNQAITLRSPQGIPLKPGRAIGGRVQKQQGGAL